MKIEEKHIAGFPCLQACPDDFDPKRKYPCLIFLHGIGSRGSMDKLKGNPFFSIAAKNLEAHNMIVFAPLDPDGKVWFDCFESLCGFADTVYEYEFTDKSRFYLMGASMGGYGTWMLGMSRHEKFAAIVPICGGGVYWDTGRLKQVPVWAFHGGADTTVSPDESRRMVDSVLHRGGDARLTIYPENKHDAWSDTYRDPKVFDWLLAHRKLNENGEQVLTDEAYDPENYG